MTFYNALLAVVICAIAYAIGEWVSTATKSWVPSVFVTAIVFLIGFWTFIPPTVCGDTTLVAMAGGIGAMMLVANMGTMISLKQFAEQWKTIVVCVFGLVGMCLFVWFICPLFMRRELIIAGLPPLTGGVVATQIMTAAAEAKGDTEAVVMAVCCYCIQGFVGYPLTSICLNKYGRAELAKLRAGEVTLTEEEIERNKGFGSTAIAKDEPKKLVPKIPDKWNTPNFMIAKLACAAWIASLLGQISFGNFKLNQMVWALIVGIVLSALGILDTNILARSSSSGIMMLGLMLVVFNGLSQCTPAMLGTIIGPMLGLIVIGVVGMGLFAFIIAKILKMSFYLAFANGLNALYGFPPNAILTEGVCDALAANQDEKGYLMSKMFPSMIVGGFVCVTITSVILAGIFAGML